MTIMNDPNLWVICALVFVIGLLLGIFMTAGGRRKWKTRYSDEVTRRERLEREHKEREAEWTTRHKEHEAELAAREKAHQADLATREREWREQERVRSTAATSTRAAAADPVARSGDLDGDGVPNDIDRRPTNDRKA